MFLLMIIILAIFSFVVGYILFITKRHGELKRLGFDGPKPKFIFGTISLRETAFDQQVNMYQKYKGKKVAGGYAFHSPFLMVTDLDLIKDVLVKHFNYFVNRRPQLKIGEDIDDSMTNIRDDQWKHVRSKVSPTFSTSKLKLMSKHVEITAKALLKNLKEKEERNEPIELKEVLSFFALDVIASAGFDVEVNSMKDTNNPFVIAAQNIMKTSKKVVIFVFILPFLLPLIRWLGISLIDKKATDTFTSFVDKAMSVRREEAGQRKVNDFVQLLVNSEHEENVEHDEASEEVKEALKTSKHRRGLTKSEIRAQAMLFILAGYDTVSTALSFTLFLLTVYPEALEKAQGEIDEKLGGTFPSYDNIQSLTFIDMCINEALRLFPPGFALERQCGQEVELQGIRLPKDYVVHIPVYAIHHDPEIWSEPEQFDPERFTPENQAARHPYAFIPFGAGPRNCVGMRLALLEMKVALVAILQNMTPVSCEKTVYPVRLNKFRITAQDGLWVKLEQRK